MSPLSRIPRASQSKAGVLQYPHSCNQGARAPVPFSTPLTKSTCPAICKAKATEEKAGDVSTK
eukprot:1160017-Pelagomonas_calceolata.AAC.5